MCAAPRGWSRDVRAVGSRRGRAARRVPLRADRGVPVAGCAPCARHNADLAQRCAGSAPPPSRRPARRSIRGPPRPQQPTARPTTPRRYRRFPSPVRESSGSLPRVPLAHGVGLVGVCTPSRRQRSMKCSCDDAFSRRAFSRHLAAKAAAEVSGVEVTGAWRRRRLPRCPGSRSRALLACVRS